MIDSAGRVELSTLARWDNLLEWWRIGRWTGLDALIRNGFFIAFVARIVNDLREPGTFWVANEFIWGWLLLPFLPLVEMVRRDVAQRPQLLREGGLSAYFFLCGVVAVGWLLLSPGFQWLLRLMYDVHRGPHGLLVWIMLPEEP